MPDARIPFTPALTFAFEIRASLAPTLHVGHGDGEKTEFTPITGGTVDGPLLRGLVLPSGGDWSNTRGRVCELDARYLLQAEDGAVIDIINRGYYHEGAETPDQYDDDLQVTHAGVYYRTSPVFRTDAPAHRWLAETVFVGLAREAEDGIVAIRMYALA
ncbi:hypothetical protein FHS43_002273 [Streptosporangium becharense]|uniref:UPF0311 protein F4562_004996 n=1 Tax=Streptosporangium becharense TaxID=1816182 RepID=A0A7W9IKV2_9ACTN|nr:DUF3237 domain-containing protein [Streptosporangium becharense]MBB2911008.1 hypothetical protein [Streptosporangium becharense]MBB5821934.1 hypothetical protein [Streptosporangium becharense]